MSDILQVGLGIVVVLGVLPTLWLAVQILCGLLPARPSRLRRTAAPRLTVLIPAHDEESRVGRAIDALMPLSGPTDRIVVIADNCSDGTAAVARRHGAEVIERNDPDAVGKGYALARGIESLDTADCDVVGVIDADTHADRDAIEILAQRAFAENGPVQGCFLHSRPPDAEAWSAFSCFAVLVNNRIRQLGRGRMGLPCQLNGSGMFVPLAVARQVDWSGGRLAEDAELGLDLALLGYNPVFEPRAMLSSPAPIGRTATLAQRSGWLSGRLSLTARRTFGALVTGCRGRRPAAVAAALDLAIPPTSLGVAMLVACAFLIAAGYAFSIPVRLPLTVWTISASGIGMAVVMAWTMHGRALLSGRDTLRIPGIVLNQTVTVAARVARRRMHWKDYTSTEAVDRDER